MLCCYHDDLDGRCSAAIVKYASGAGRFVPARYNRPLPRLTVAQDETVFVVDYLPEPDIMRDLRNRSGRLVWIDHHASAIAEPEYEGLEGLRVDGRAACELTWDFLMPGKPAPHAVRLIADRDVWRWRYGEQTAAFCEGIRLQPHCPEAAIWSGLFDNRREDIEAIIRDGTVCLRYQRALAADMIDAYGFETEIEGYRAYAVNCNLFGSDVFGARYSQYELCACFTFDGSRYKVTLYSQSVDVLTVARRYGGGGHRQAAGFVCDELPFRQGQGRGDGHRC